MSDWHVAYKTSNGELKGASALLSNFPDPLPSGISVKSFPGQGRLDKGMVWNQSTLEYGPRPAPRLISYGKYLSRFTLQERGQMYQSTHADIRAFFRAIDYEGIVGSTADLDGTFIRAITNLAVSGGIIDNARKAEILT